jgi:chromosome segregation protein
LYLKKIEIQGFKSFADKISLEFKSGITSIVGPNGSGKSNIADAVRWVLGEQSAKTLRGTKMEDVIFAGTEHRKPLGFAEVSLTIDNSDSSLPVEYSEVTVMRRVFRSGESEYFINKTSCRLKDIHELFVDTGIGKDGYSVIGQGKVDEILSAKSEDRRHIFEEASGIMKYKLRKLEAEKKLELTKQNLLRINDIINELEIQLEPLQQQSETARSFLNLREELKEIEVNVYIENITKFRDRLKEFEKDYETIRENINNENVRLENTTNTNKEKNELLKSLEEKLEQSRQQFYSIDGNLEKCNSEINLNNERINNLTQNIDRINSEISGIDGKLQTLSRESDSKTKKLTYLNKKNEEYSSLLQEYEKQMKSVLAVLDENERHIEDLKADVMDKIDLLSDKKVQLNSEKAHLDGLFKRKKSIDLEINQIVLDVDKENMKKEDLMQSIYNAKDSLKHASERLDVLQSKKAGALSALSEKRKRQNTLRSEIQFKTSRYRMLKDMEQNLEGYNRSVKQVLQACKEDSSFGAGIRGALAQLITVDRRYETAIEMSLGGALQNVVTDSEEDAKRAIEYLKNKKYGRATFLPISSVKGKYIENTTIQQLKNFQGYCGIGSDLVECAPDFKGIILSLLGRVVIAEDLDAGIRIARKFGYSFRIVTLEGEILNTSGAMTGGSIENKGTGILSRSREIIELKDETEKLEKENNLLEVSINELIGE